MGGWIISQDPTSRTSENIASTAWVSPLMGENPDHWF